MTSYAKLSIAAALATVVMSGCGAKRAATSSDGSGSSAADATVDRAVPPLDTGPAADGAQRPDGAGGASDGPFTLPDGTGPKSDVVVSGPDGTVGGSPRKIAWQKEPGGPDFARGMGGTSANDIWVGGTSGDVWHSTGNGQWARRDIDTPGDVNGFWGTGPSNVYATAYINRVSRWNGTGWDRFDFQGGVTFRAVWGSGPNDVYAVGGAVFRSSGDGMWRLEPDDVSDPLVSVWGSGATDVWVLLGGSAGIIHSKGDGKWSAPQTGGTSMSPGIAVWGSGPNDIYMLRGGEVVHSTGDGLWLSQPIDRGPTEVLECICGSGPRDVYIGTDTGRMLRSVGDGRWHAERFLPVDGRVIDISQCWAASNGEIFAVTGDGTYHGRPTP
jgi:hypothetical protein